MTKLNFSKTWAMLAVGGVLGVYALSFATAFGAVVPTVDTIIRNGSNVTVTSAPVGSNVQAYATVASSSGPVVLGTVDFSRYGNTSCSGTPTVEAGVLLASGSVNSSTTTVPASGLSYKVSYNGQGDVYATTTGSCVSVLPTSSSVSVNSTLSSTTVYVGTSVFQSATLSGLTSNATGTVGYGVYTNNVCNAGKVDAGVKNVLGGLASSSNSIQFNTVGTLYWQSQYSGDQYNGGANGPCQALQVLATTTPTPTPTTTPVSGTLSGNVYNDLNRNLVRESGENGISGVTIKLYDRSVWWNWKSRWSGSANFRTTTTDSSGNYSFQSLPDGIYGIEEIIPSGWKQLSGDFRWVLVTGGKSIGNLDFANIAKVNATSTATSTPKDKIEKKIEKLEKKAAKKEAQRQKKINKLLERMKKLDSRDDD